MVVKYGLRLDEIIQSMLEFNTLEEIMEENSCDEETVLELLIKSGLVEIPEEFEDYGED